MERNKKAGIYIHIPFCVQKCIYCDFNSIPGCSEELQSGYFDALKEEITAFNNQRANHMTARRQPSPDDGQAGSEDIHMAPVNNNNAAEKTSISRPAEADSDISVFSDTLFIGGGTPSSVPPPLIEELMACIRKSKGAVFSGRDENVSRDETEERAHRGQTKVSSLLAEDAEVTIEVNPGTVDYEGLLSYRRAGINRLSMGVQSFCDEELRFLGRIHSAEDAERCFHDARKAGFDNINIDLIFGFPGNTVKS